MRRSEVWLIDLSPTVGAEMQKTRPAVIVNDDQIGILPLKIIAPITDWKPHYEQVPWMIRVEPSSQNGLTKVSAVDAFPVRSLSEQRFVRRLGFVEPNTMIQIAAGLKVVLHL